jgi:hypothetical protein
LIETLPKMTLSSQLSLVIAKVSCEHVEKVWYICLNIERFGILPILQTPSCQFPVHEDKPVIVVNEQISESDVSCVRHVRYAAEFFAFFHGHCEASAEAGTT